MRPTIKAPFTVEQIKAARGLLGWTQNVFAEKSGVSIAALKNIERRGGEVHAYQETVDKIARAFKGAGIEFIEGNNGGPGVRLKK